MRRSETPRRGPGTSSPFPRSSIRRTTKAINQRGTRNSECGTIRVCVPRSEFVMSLIERTATDLLALQAKGEATAEAVTDAFLAAIKLRDSRVKAFQHVDEEDARRQARA